MIMMEAFALVHINVGFLSTAPNSMSRLTAAERYLIDRIRESDAEAWRQLVDRYHGRLRAFAARELPSPSDADDIVQETFIGLLQSLGGFRGDSSLETFLFLILRRRVADYYRRRRPPTSAEVADSSKPNDEDELYSAEMTASKSTRF